MGPAHILFLAVSLPYIAALHTQLHKHMTADELRSVFHVDHHSLVPEYQVVQLNHHIAKRNIPSAANDEHHTANQYQQNYGSQKYAHDKVSKQDFLIKNSRKFKDLNAPNTKIKTVTFDSKQSDSFDELWPVDDDSDAIFVGSDNNSDKVSDRTNSDFQNNQSEDSLKDVEHVEEGLDDDTHKIKFEVFGKPMELVLKKTDGLFKKDGLKMWSISGNDTEPHGVEIIEAEHMGEEKDHIGETYQDEDSMAALVIRRDPKEGLLVEGSIGHDLVIKPLPSTLSPNTTPRPPLRKTIPPEDDDEMFMDPNQDDMVSIDTGLPIKRSKVSKKNLASTEKHTKSTLVNQKLATDSTTSNTDNVNNVTDTINKMNDNAEDIIYDDEQAKAEIKRMQPIAAERAYEDSEEEIIDLRSAIIQALSGAKHVVYKRDVAESTEDELSDYAYMEPDRLHKRYRKKRSGEYVDEPIINKRTKRSKRDAPYVIYPEILVIVDYDGYRLHGGDNLQIKRYFVSFWNGVDLRYKLLKGPKIRISIAGIIISRGRDATPYLERNRVGRDAIDSAAALTDMGKYLFRERRLPVYDIAVAVTKYDMCRRRKGGRCTKGTAGKVIEFHFACRILDMCRRQYANDVCNRGTAGFAYVGGACVVNKRLEKVNSVAIIEDTGGFSGIIVAAHEVGHLLGAVHDGSPPPSYLGGPGAEKCRWEDGFIMSDLRHTEKGFRWSPCSVVSFHHFLNGDTATCLFNSPHEDESLPRVLPGKLLSLDAQCRKDRGTNACFKDERVCAQLFCFDAGSGYCVAYRPAAEGSPCGDGQYCINGRCVAEHENIIPDYSQHTPSYIRRENSPYYNDTVQRYIVEQTTQPYRTFPVVPIGQTYSQPYSPYVQSSPYQNQYTYPTQKPHQYQYNSIPSPRSSFSYSPYYSTTRNPYDFRNFPIYHYTAETKQTQYTVPSSSQDVPTEPTTSTTTTITPTTTRTTSSTTTTTTTRPFFLRFTFSTTKNPYDFKDFTTKPPLSKSTLKVNSTSTTIGTTTTERDLASTTSSTPSTSKPKYGFFSKLDLRNYFNKTTTKTPFDFDLTNYKDISNNNIKRSYSIQSYFGSQSNPVANIANYDNGMAIKVTTVVPLPLIARNDTQTK